MRTRSLLALSFVLAVAMVLPAAGTASAAGPVVGSYSRVANASYIRMRTGPGTNYAIVTNVHKGQIVKVVSGPHKGLNGTAMVDWFKITYRSWTGYSVAAGLVHTGLAGASLAKTYASSRPKMIVVSLARQQMEAYQNGKLWLITAVTTGRPELRTPAGTTRVYRKDSPHKFVSPWPKGHEYWYPTGYSDYALYFRDNGFWIHDTTYRPVGGYGYGTSVPHIDPDGVERTGSRGCVNTPLWAMAAVYKWATVSPYTWVIVTKN